MKYFNTLFSLIYISQIGYLNSQTMSLFSLIPPETSGLNFMNNVQETYEKKEYQTPCYSANLSGLMYPEGQVYPCEILDDSHKIGNIRDFKLNFRDLWLSQKAKEEVNFIRKTKCFCTHECFNAANIVFNPKYYPKLTKIASSIK